MSKTVTIDIHSKGEYPSCALSNFAEYEFYIDGVKCMNMEGFLQSLKFRNKAKQRRVCLLSGSMAKKASEHPLASVQMEDNADIVLAGKKILAPQQQVPLSFGQSL